MTSSDVQLMSYLRVDQSQVEHCDALCAALSTAERSELDRLSAPLRRRQWLAGRSLARQLVERAAGADQSGDIESGAVQILTHGERGLGTRPRVSIGGRELPWSLSIAHSERGVVAALAADNSCNLGIDLVSLDGCVAARPSFQRLWFNTAERVWAGADPLRAASIWGIKEAVYKAANRGESWEPRQVEVRPTAAGCFKCSYRGLPLLPLFLNVRVLDGHALAVACLPRDAAAPAPDWAALAPATAASVQPDFQLTTY